MPADMKQTIAQAAADLIMRKGGKKLTVKDIVEECHITRQAFYYHFADIPELFAWMMERETDQMLKAVLSKGTAEDGLRCFLVMATNLLPYIKRGMDSNYRPELEQLLMRYMQQFFAQAAEVKHLYSARSAAEIRLILRYHSCAVLGLLHQWTEEDSAHLDEIAHTVYGLMTEGIPPAGRTD